MVMGVEPANPVHTGVKKPIQSHIVLMRALPVTRHPFFLVFILSVSPYTRVKVKIPYVT